MSEEVVAATRPRHPRRSSLRDVAAWADGRAGTATVVGSDRVEVTGITLSSLRVRPGDVYVALPGARTHGIMFLADALAAGATAVVTDPEGATALQGRVPALVLDRPRALLGELSAEIYGRPAASLRMMAITGTQGKTTTSRLAESGLLAAGVTAGVIGTVGTRIAGQAVPTALTTPEAPDLHGLFARMVEDGVVTCAMEVSSHALVLGRVDGVVFDVAGFTNLGRDHLDFHTDVEDYYRAKAALFTPERARRAVICVDDEHGRRLAAETSLPLRTLSVTGREADWRAVDVRLGASGSSFTILGPDGLRVPAGVPIPGHFNIANALLAVALCVETGCDAAGVAAGISGGGGVPGRFERVEAGQDFTVVVDYAHKPDALAAALGTLRELTAGRLVVVLGAGGDRDTGKRPLMGEIAAGLADVLVVTDDNPRSEDPAEIRAALLAGTVGGGAEVHEVGDRRGAIRAAVRLAQAGDIVLIAGKGHETGQEVAGVVHPFDDRVVAAEELSTP